MIDPDKHTAKPQIPNQGGSPSVNTSHKNLNTAPQNHPVRTLVLTPPLPAFRHEWKSIINTADDSVLCSQLTKLLKHDPHAGPEGSYLIRSLYFDNDDDKALREKLDGLPHREKFRLRLYSPEDTMVKLEKKEKHLKLTRKTTAYLTRDQSLQILSGDLQWMASSDQQLIVEFYTKLRYQRLKPQTIVEYQREAFLYRPGNVRVTMDRNIRTGLFSKDLFNPRLTTLGSDLQHQTVLEVKYDAFLPDLIRDLVQLGNRQTSSVSKYALCRFRA
jgi:hypothetical protein